MGEERKSGAILGTDLEVFRQKVSFVIVNHLHAQK